ALRATVETISTCCGLCVAPGLLAMCCAFGSVHMDEGPYLLLAGVCPPVAMGIATFHGDEFSRGNSKTGLMFFFIFLGLMFWGIVASFVWVAARERFKVLTGRTRLESRPRRQEPLTPTE